MPISAMLYLAVVVIAVIVGGFALVSMVQRREVLARAGAMDEEAPAIALRSFRQPMVHLPGSSWPSWRVLLPRLIESSAR